MTTVQTVPLSQLVASQANVRTTSNASIAENTVRQAMHQTDQFDAIKALFEGGMSESDIAARFGLSDQIVKQRLKLASLSPKVLAAFRNNELTIEQAEAFTVSSDHARQDAVLKEINKACSDRYLAEPRPIRQALTANAFHAISPHSLFVGEDAYVAAGGRITQDLFSEREDIYYEDAAIIDRLVAEKLEAIAQELRAEGWGEVRTSTNCFWSAHEKLNLPKGGGRSLTVEEESLIKTLTVQYDALSDKFYEIERNNGKIDPAEKAIFDALEVEIEAIERTARDDWSAVDGKEGMVAFVFMDHHGVAVIHRGLTRREDRQSEAAEHLPMPSALPDAPKRKPEFSATLLHRLTTERSLAMRSEMANNPAVALDTLVWTLASQKFGLMSTDGRVTKISFDFGVGISDMEKSKAGATMIEHRRRWEKLLPSDPRALWSFIVAKPQEWKLELLAFLVASSLDAVQKFGAPATANSHDIHAALGLDMTDWWEPTADSYLSGVSKDKTAEALREAGIDAERIADVTRAKKHERIARAEKLLAGTRWLPSPLRAPVTTAQVANDAEADEEQAACMYAEPAAYNDAYAALCIWEAMLDLRSATPAISVQWNAEDTVAMRCKAMALAPAVSAMWGRLTDEERIEALSFDRQFVPTVIRLANWQSDGAARLPSIADVLAVLREKLAPACPWFTVILLYPEEVSSGYGETIMNTYQALEVETAVQMAREEAEDGAASLDTLTKSELAEKWAVVAVIEGQHEDINPRI